MGAIKPQRGLHELALVRPDAVLLDLGLPGMSGVEVLKRLREWSQVPVLILSVKDQPEDKVEALEAGAGDYVTKPFEPTELLARFRAIMRRRDHRVEEPIFVNGKLEIDFTARSDELFLPLLQRMRSNGQACKRNKAV